MKASLAGNSVNKAMFVNMNEIVYFDFLWIAIKLSIQLAKVKCREDESHETIQSFLLV
jgi:hypothetical protein